MKCKQCTSQFEITDEDRKFYGKFEMPEPTLCPPCRSQRRLAFRNERTLYKRKCDLTKKDIISIYPPDAPFPVYERSVWHADDWDALDHGRDFDFSRPFFEQFKELQLSVPHLNLIGQSLENCSYVNQSWYSKDSYLCFDMGFTENALFCDVTYHSKNIADCSFVRNVEYSYYLIDCTKCFGSVYLQDCNNCSDAFFSFDCNNCQNVAFSFNLRNKKNHLFNKPVSEEEFKNAVKDIKSGSGSKWNEYIKTFHQKVLLNAIHKETHNINVENCLGDYIINSRNCYYCYDVDSSEDIRYCNRMDEKIINSMDLDNASIAQNCYEGTSIAGNNIYFNVTSYHPGNSDLYYCDTSLASSDCFGCIGMKHKKYCILNKQYSKEEYRKLKNKIIEHMKKTDEWGEFFPVALSPFAYNETLAQEYYPLTKEEVLKRGWKWKEPDKKEYQKQTCVLADSITETSDEIMKEILACEGCGKNYKIITQELRFYRNMGLPIPRKCNDCRHRERFVLRNPRKLWERKCMKCGKNIRTSYAPDRPEKVYCEECYLKTVY